MAGTFVEHVNQLAAALTNTLITNINTTATNQGSISTVATYIANVNLTAGSIANVNLVAADLLNINAVATDLVNINAVAGDLVNINAVQADLANINTVATNVANVNVVAANIVDVNAFARTYYINAVAPTIITHPSLSTGDLWYDTVNTVMMEYNGTIWQQAYNISLASDSLTLTNKFMDSITNTIGADHVHYKVRNASGAPIPINTVVTASGTQPGTDYIQVIPVTDPQTQIAIGIVHTTLLNNGTGTVVNTGVHDNMDTSAWAVGTILYPSATGGFTATKPTSGVFQSCAIVLRQHATSGTMLVEFTEPKVIGSTTQMGYVQLNDTLTSTSTVLALTANQGKLLNDALAGKQATLVSGTNIKTVGGTTLLGTGDIPINDTSKLPLTGGTMTGAITALRETKVAMGANDIDLAAGNVFTKTISGITTLTVSNWLATGNANSFILELTNGGAFAVTWFAGVKWAGGTAPTLTASGVDILGFYSHDGGTTVRGIVLAKDSK